MGNGSNCGSLLSLPDHRKIYSLRKTVALSAKQEIETGNVLIVSR